MPSSEPQALSAPEVTVEGREWKVFFEVPMVGDSEARSVRTTL